MRVPYDINELFYLRMKKSCDSVADIWGNCTPYFENWPERVDKQTEEAVCSENIVENKASQLVISSTDRKTKFDISNIFFENNTWRIKKHDKS